MKHVISVNNGEDYIKKTGLGNTWVYTDKGNATTFDSKKAAKDYINILPTALTLSIEKAK